MHPNKEILIVDDERSVGQSFCDLLRDSGYEARAVQTGTEALAALKSERIGLVLTDVDMPTMNGLDLTRAIRRKHPGVAVLLMTGADVETLVRQALGEGAMRVFYKPVDPEILLAAVERVMQTRRAGG